MDPDETLFQLLLALHDEDVEDAINYMEDLSDWLEKGGAMPKVEKVIDRVLEESEAHEDGEGDEDGDGEADEELPMPTPAAAPATPAAPPAAPPARRRTKA